MAAVELELQTLRLDQLKSDRDYFLSSGFKENKELFDTERDFWNALSGITRRITQMEGKAMKVA